MPLFIKQLTWLCIVALLATNLLTACTDNHASHHEKQQFLATKPIYLDTSIIKDYVCQIHAIQHIELRALEKGYVHKIYVDEGQLVKKGQLMFEIMPVLYQAELQKAKAETEFARIEYQNTRRLADSNIVSKAEALLGQAKYQKAVAEQQLAQAHLTFTQIRAPFDGIMDQFNVRLGSLVNEGDLLTKLSDNSKMWVYFNVPEAEYLDYKTHAANSNLQHVGLIMANNAQFSHYGKVETIEADFNNETGNIAFRATFPNPEGLLRHGETGNVQMTIPMKKALIIPQKATFELLEKKYVFVIDEDNKLQQREIQIGASLPHLYAVQNGLKPSDKILLEGLQKAHDGDKVSYKIADLRQLIPTLSVYTE